MAAKLRPCLGGIVKHSWQFIRNVNVTTYLGHSAHIALKGRYRCRNGCGAIKYGSFDPNYVEPEATASKELP